jgi:hypothetical protein
MFDWPELRADGPIFGSHCLVEEQLLQIKFDWPVRLANSTGQWLSRPTSPTNCDDPVHGSSPGETHLVGSWRDPSLPTLKAGPEKMKSLLPGHRCHTLFSWFRVHGSGPGEIVFLAVLPSAMIRYMVVVLAR